jgi:hypothetical protein
MISSRGLELQELSKREVRLSIRCRSKIQADKSLKRSIAHSELVRDFHFLEKSKPNNHFREK